MQQKRARFIQRHNLSTTWSTINPILQKGELGFETDTGSLKIGDGSTHWNNLPLITSIQNQYQLYTAGNGLVLDTKTNILSTTLDYDVIYYRKDLWYLKALNNVVVENIASLTSGITKDASSNNIFYIRTEAALSLQYGQLNAIADTSFLSLASLNINQTLFQTITNVIFTTIPTLSVWLDSEDKLVVHDTEFNTQVTAVTTTSSDICELASCIYNSQVCGETEASVSMSDLSFFNLSTIANIHVSDIWLIPSISQHIIDLFACLSVLKIVELNTLNNFVLNTESSLKVTKLDNYAIINDWLIFDNSAQLYSTISIPIQSDNDIFLNEDVQLNVVMGQFIKAITTQYINSAVYCAIVLDSISLKLLIPELSASIYLNSIIGAELQVQAYNSLLSSVYLTYTQTRLYNSDEFYFNSCNFLQNASTSLLQNVLETTLSSQVFVTSLTSVDHQTETNWQFETNAHFVVLIYPWQSNDLLIIKQTYGHTKEGADYLILN